MSLAQRVRDLRYIKGWGPDELSSRAAISRTALYWIESGKTERPRAGTLRRIAIALDVSMDTLLGHAKPAETPSLTTRDAVPSPVSTWTRGTTDWYPAEGAPMAAPASRQRPRFGVQESPHCVADDGPISGQGFANETARRARELTAKFQVLLASSVGDAVARIVEETHRLLPLLAPAPSPGSTTRGL